MIDYPIQLNTLEFKSVVNELIQGVDEIVETGTFHGNGSTKVFAETGKYVFTMECNFNNFLKATNNLVQYENVVVLHALSLPRDLLIENLLNEEFKINTTYDSKYPKSFYMREISQQVTIENGLEAFCFNPRKQLIFLDSAGGVGYLEFLWVMNLPKNFLVNKVLMLDDINHIKHSRSVEWLFDNGFNVQVSQDKRFAWVNLSEYESK